VGTYRKDADGRRVGHPLTDGSVVDFQDAAVIPIDEAEETALEDPCGELPLSRQTPVPHDHAGQGRIRL